MTERTLLSRRNEYYRSTKWDMTIKFTSEREIFLNFDSLEDDIDNYYQEA